MSDDTLTVELVAADRLVWSGEGTLVRARTSDGDIGILAGHAPVMSVMAAGLVEVVTSGERLRAAVDGGFISVANNRVSIIAGRMEMGDEIDLSAARSELEEAKAAGAGESDPAVRLAEARVEAAQST